MPTGAEPAQGCVSLGILTSRAELTTMVLAVVAVTVLGWALNLALGVRGAWLPSSGTSS